jgi:hypothetical protein
MMTIVKVQWRLRPDPTPACPPLPLPRRLIKHLPTPPDPSPFLLPSRAHLAQAFRLRKGLAPAAQHMAIEDNGAPKVTARGASQDVGRFAASRQPPTPGRQSAWNQPLFYLHICAGHETAGGAAAVRGARPRRCRAGDLLLTRCGPVWMVRGGLVWMVRTCGEWDFRLACVKSPPRNAFFMSCVASDGGFIASGSNDRTVRLWRVPEVRMPMPMPLMSSLHGRERQTN